VILHPFSEAAKRGFKLLSNGVNVIDNWIIDRSIPCTPHNSGTSVSRMHRCHVRCNASQAARYEQRFTRPRKGRSKTVKTAESAGNCGKPDGNRSTCSGSDALGGMGEMRGGSSSVRSMRSSLVPPLRRAEPGKGCADTGFSIRMSVREEEDVGSETRDIPGGSLISSTEEEMTCAIGHGVPASSDRRWER